MPSLTDEARRYHLQQYLKPYESTVAFADFIRQSTGQDRLEGRVMDVGCGAGANIFWFDKSGLTKDCEVTGIDSDSYLIKVAGANNRKRHFACLDFNDPLPECDVALSTQVLSFIEDWRPALAALLRATKQWLFVSSLFWDGVSTHTHASDGDKVDAHYNVIDITAMSMVCEAAGFSASWQRYAPQVELYGRHSELRSRTQGGLTFSGPILMPWAFAAVKRAQ